MQAYRIAMMMRTMAAEAIPSELLREYGEQIRDPLWRIENLYMIMDADGEAVRFTPNRAQRRFLRRMWHRNIILKARQLGFTTLIQLLILDSMLFTPNVRCGVIAHKKEDAEAFFSDKILFAYDRLPELVRLIVPPVKRAGGTLRLANNSQVRVATSLRSGTLQILHISEFAKLGRERPLRASEVVTGTLPTVQADGLVFIESTAEGAEGEFHRMTEEARKLLEAGETLNRKQFKFHFFPWWQDPKYVLPEAVGRMVLSDAETQYFDKVEQYAGKAITPAQRAWYMQELAQQGSEEKMWREFPSTPDEPFQVSVEGTYYKQQMQFLRKNNRIRDVPYMPGIPVHTFWDLGANDSTVIWFMQVIGQDFRFIRHYEASGEDLTHFVRYLQSTGYVYGSHYLPHDATHERLSARGNESIEDMLRGLGLTRIEIVPRVDNLLEGIEATRRFFVHCWFDEAGCKAGLEHLELYRKEWDHRLGVWKSTHRHDAHSHTADAFRQAAQSFDVLLRQQQGSQTRRRTRAAVT